MAMNWTENWDGSFTAKDGRDTFDVKWTETGGKIYRNGDAVAGGYSSRIAAMQGAENFRHKK